MSGHQPFVVKKTTGRDAAIAILAGGLILGFVIWGILHMSQGVTGQMLSGQIVGKHFKPRPEEQVTIGQGGLQQRSIDGDYTFEVLVPGNRSYTVWVDKTVFEAHHVGDKLSFLPPPPRPAVSP